ncbi:unnamed protein product [Owenia fusiformis]|uniref:Membrane magnesium transporter n=1 Tax=Owenia fusiformis TaxID=6347 RepID=A0A8S4NJR8_OWEFU|nr:unnamed protein product [Owenia fusiformis]
MSSSIHKFFVISGLLALLHAAYSAAQHRTYVRLTEQEFTVLPADILLQCLAGLILTIYGVVNVAGSFRDIRAAGDTENKTWETSQNRPSFYIFNHRGRHLFGGDYDDSECDTQDYIEDQ